MVSNLLPTPKSIYSRSIKLGMVLLGFRYFQMKTIFIFPEFEGRGYAKETIAMFKADFDIIIADRVRYTATGF